jgi:hypothetical protein
MAISIIHGDVRQCISDLEHALQQATASLRLVFQEDPALTARALLQAQAEFEYIAFEARRASALIQLTLAEKERAS